MTENLLNQLACSLIQWGPGMIIAALVLFGLYKFATSVGLKLVDSSRQQAVAIEGLTKAIENSVCRDNTEHREIIILLKVIRERLDTRLSTSEERDGS